MLSPLRQHSAAVAITSSTANLHVLPQQWRLIEVDVTFDELQRRQQHLLQLIHPSHSVMDFNIGAVLWFGGRAAGIKTCFVKSTVFVQKRNFQLVGVRLCSERLFLVCHFVFYRLGL